MFLVISIAHSASEVKQRDEQKDAARSVLFGRISEEVRLVPPVSVQSVVFRPILRKRLTAISKKCIIDFNNSFEREGHIWDREEAAVTEDAASK